MATLEDKRISISVNDETIEGVIVNAISCCVEVVIIAPEWCSGIIGRYYVAEKRTSRQMLFEYAEKTLLAVFKVCNAIKSHKENVKAFEAEYNERYKRLNIRYMALYRAINIVKDYVQQGVIDEVCDQHAILLPMQREMRDVLRRRNQLIYKYAGSYLNDDIGLNNVVDAVNKICGTNLNRSKRTYIDTDANNLDGMARIGFVADAYEVFVITDDVENIPHIHIRDRVTMGRDFETCVQLNSNEYFQHGNNINAMNDDLKREFARFMAAPCRNKRYATTYEYAVDMWNDNNLGVKAVVSYEETDGRRIVKIPDYENM